MINVLNKSKIEVSIEDIVDDGGSQTAPGSRWNCPYSR